ncbi:MAG TPA: NAD(P)/FAD-dependent oxidoreductase, partial [Gemmatimonadales bacterium]
MHRNCDVLVIGAGPAGSATATYAARAGLSVIVADRAKFPRDKPCAEYLSPEASRDLDEIGVIEKIESAGAERLHGFRLVSDDGADVCGRYANTPFTPYRPFGYALPRLVLDAILLDAARAAGAAVHESTMMDRLTVEDGHVRGATLRGPQGTIDIRARVVVGADGLNSRVARQLGLARQGGLLRLGLVTHLDGVQGMTDVGEMFASDGWYVGLAPVAPGVVNFAMVVPRSESAVIGKETEAYFLAKLRTVPELARRLQGARIMREVQVTGPFARRASRPIADGALLVGDAADFYDPFTGEGIFAALRGARLAVDTMAQALGGGAATRRALRPYVAARRRAFFGKWVLERVVGLGATRPGLMRRFTRQLARRSHIADLW